VGLEVVHRDPFQPDAYLEEESLGIRGCELPLLSTQPFVHKLCIGQVRRWGFDGLCVGSWSHGRRSHVNTWRIWHVQKLAVKVKRGPQQ